MYLEMNYWDVITYVPRKDIKFIGFGLFGNYNNISMQIRVKW